MKHSAASAFEPNGAGTVLVRGLADCVTRARGRIHLHAVGHSAGSIFHSYLLPRIADAVGVPIETLCLMAPAITVDDYMKRLDPMIGTAIRRLVVFTMAKDFELDDCVAVYRKSLLYLISRALEPRVGEPILGLEESIRADARLCDRFGLAGGVGTASVVWSQTAVETGRRASRSTSHGGFDNDVATMDSIMREILNLQDADHLRRDFPPDTENRAIRPSAEPPSSEANARPSGGQPIQGAASSAIPKGTSRGRKSALCIGIDDYPNPDHRLFGCVADSRAWADAFRTLGFAVDMLNDAEATRDAILGRLDTMVRSAAQGDVIALQFAGHGTQVPDVDGDEKDDGQDEAFCPYDFTDGRLIIDDDFRAVFSGLKNGVNLTCFFDTCHSGTIARLAVNRAAGNKTGRPRFVVLRSDVAAAHKTFRLETALGAEPRSASAPNDMPPIVFAACRPEEVALETDGRGAFSSRAVPLLTQAGAVTNERFQELVLNAFGPSPSQHPNLDCAEKNKRAPLLMNSDAFMASGRRSGDAGAARETAIADLLDAVCRLIRS